MAAPRVLVAYASKHGSTAGIAAAIAETIGEASVRAELETADRVASVDRYDAVVLGSAVYLGRWQKEAEQFGRRFEAALAARSVWLFSSGPLDHSAEERDIAAPGQAARLAARIGARGHRWFGGALAGDAEGFMERLMIHGGAVGDFRDLDGVRRWALEVGTAIVHQGEPVAVG